MKLYLIQVFVKTNNMIKMMQSNFVMFMILGLLICFPSSLDAVECRCSPRTTDNQFGQVLGLMHANSLRTRHPLSRGDLNHLHLHRHARLLQPTLHAPSQLVLCDATANLFSSFARSRRPVEASTKPRCRLRGTLSRHSLRSAIQPK